MNKWKKIAELCDYIAKDSTLDIVPYEHYFKCICHAPNVGYRSWIFNYRGVLVALYDLGNGHYDFHTAVTRFDTFVAKLCEKFPKLAYKLCAWTVWDEDMKGMGV